MVVNDKLATQLPQLGMPAIVDVKKEIDACYVLWTFVSLPSEEEVLEKHIII